MRRPDLQRDADWRHWLAAAMVATLVLTAGWSLFVRPGSQPTAAAPAGAHPRMEDAPEVHHPLAPAP